MCACVCVSRSAAGGSVRVWGSHPMPSTFCWALAPSRAALCTPSDAQPPLGPPASLASRLCAPLLLLIWGLHTPVEGWPSSLGLCSLVVRTCFLPRDFLLEKSQPGALGAARVRKGQGVCSPRPALEFSQGQVQPDWLFGGRGEGCGPSGPLSLCLLCATAPPPPPPPPPASLPGRLWSCREPSRYEETPTLAWDLAHGCPRH